jgi:hypothetical protein
MIRRPKSGCRRRIYCQSRHTAQNRLSLSTGRTRAQNCLLILSSRAACYYTDCAFRPGGVEHGRPLSACDVFGQGD